MCVGGVCVAAGLRWAPPRHLTELDDTEDTEDPSVTEDKLTIVWTSGRRGGAGSTDIWTATRARVDAPFGNISNISELNDTSSESSPEISADGSTIFFASDRNGDNDIFTSRRVGNGWEPPTRVDALSIAGAEETEVALTPDGLTVFLVRDNHFFHTTRSGSTFGTLLPIPELDVADDVASPTLGDGARVVYFHLGQPRQLYVSRLQDDGRYGQPSRVEELDIPDRTADPFITGDEHYMIYNCVNSICDTTRP